MKKLLMTLAIVTATVSLVAAQNFADKSYRDQIRTARNQAAATKLNQAVTERNFTFTAYYMQPNFGGLIQVSNPNNYFSVYPNYFDMYLPYAQLQQSNTILGVNDTQGALINTPMQITKLLNFMSNTYEYQSNEVNGIWYITIKVANVQNQVPPTEQRFYNLTIHLTVTASTGAATLTLSSDFMPSITYTGQFAYNL